MSESLIGWASGLLASLAFVIFFVWNLDETTVLGLKFIFLARAEGLRILGLVINYFFLT
jgi:hypothetical protein